MINHLEEKIYCINPDCFYHLQGIPNFSLTNFDEISTEDTCSFCQTPILIRNKYLLAHPLYGLNRKANSEVWKLFDTTEEDETPQIIKILIVPDYVTSSIAIKLRRLFRRESKVLPFLNEFYPRLGIPQVNDYFIINLPSKRWQCLLMDEVRGINLITYVERYGRIDNNLALDWLNQLLDVLDKIHQHRLLHRDIKPSNIMLTEDNERLILIDFGAVIMEDITITSVIGTDGYMASEQREGKPCKQSDFYALGYTFIYLLTGISPNTLKETNSNWRNYAPDISPLLADLIDDLISANFNNRPENAQAIKDRLQKIINNEIDETIDIYSPIETDNNQGSANLLNPDDLTINTQSRSSFLFHYLSLFGISLFITILISIARSFGLFEGIELKAYDTLMQMRLPEGKDPRLLLITITEEDVQNQPREERGAASLSDQSLEQLLTKLEQSQATAIGLDIYRDNPVKRAYPFLAKRMKNSDRFFAICFYGDPGVNPPSEVSPQRQGFNNIILDTDNFLRRNLLAVESPEPCQNRNNPYSLSFQLAKRHITIIHPKIQFISRNPQGYLQLGKTVFKTLKKPTAGYQNFNDLGHQILINYRNTQTIAETVTLTEFLKEYPPEKVENRIVLIGTVAPSFNDHRWYTPLKTMTGIEVQAYLTSQILSTVLDHRPLIWSWSQWGDNLWIFGWSFIGGILVWQFPSQQKQCLAFLVALIVLGGICWVILLLGGWIPLIPSGLVLVVTWGIVRIYSQTLGELK